MRVLLRALVGVVCVTLLSAQLSVGAKAQSSQSGNLDFTKDKVGIIVGVVAVAAVVVVLVVVHARAGKRTITGCVTPGASAMTLIHDGDKSAYVLGGDTSALQAGHRMTLHVKRVRPKDAGGAPTWQVRKSEDAGLCQP